MPRIARRFNAGFARGTSQFPQGRQNRMPTSFTPPPNIETKPPNSKHQHPEKYQAPNTNAHAVLEFGPWNFSGAWMLVLGAFPLCAFAPLRLRVKSFLPVPREIRNRFAFLHSPANKGVIARPNTYWTYSHGRALSDPVGDIECVTTETIWEKQRPV